MLDIKNQGINYKHILEEHDVIFFRQTISMLSSD